MIRVAACAFVAFAAAPAIAGAATIKVTTGADQFGSGKACSLREAVEAARLDGKFGGCKAGSGRDRIALEGASRYRLTRAASPPTPSRGTITLLGPATIAGTGHGRATIDAAALHAGAFNAGGEDAVFDRVVIRNGEGGSSRGGAVTVNIGGDVAIRRSVIVGNEATDGGGLYSYGSLFLRETIVRRNHAVGHGGGIFVNGGSLFMVGVTVSDNRSPGPPGTGGGLDVLGGDVDIVNSTFSGNRAAADGGGIGLTGGDVSLLNVTITNNQADTSDGGGNGGGIAQIGGDIAARNSIVAGNVDAGNGSDPDCDGTVSFTFSLVGSATCTFFPNTNIVGVAPGLLPLRSNGGPTPTHALRKSSKAINAAGSGAPSTDQRGVKRVNPDMGAYERR